MYDNVPSRFVPDIRSDTIYPLGSLDFVHNTDSLNVTEELLLKTADQWGEKRAIVDHDTGVEYTYRELRDAVNRFAGGLTELGVEPGDRVLWRLDDTLEAIIAPYAVWKLGAVTVPTILQTRSRELEYLIADTEAAHVITSDREFGEVKGALDATDFVENVVVHGDEAGHGYHTFRELLATDDPDADPAPTDPFDAAVVYYTGGTTGKPKGCLGSHAGMVSAVHVDGRTGRDVRPDDVFFTPAPVGHGLGNNEKINYPYKFGAETVLASRPSPAEWLDAIEEHGVTIFAGAATMYRMMVNNLDLESADLSSVRLAISGGERLDRHTYRTWVDRTGVDICNTLGMQPFLHWIITPYHRGEKREMPSPLAIGKLSDGYEGKIVDIDDPGTELERGQVGRLAIRGPTNIAYWDNLHPEMPEKMANDTHEGWGLTDDAFYRDEDGFLHFVNRLDDLIVSGGRQIASAEVEEVLGRHELVDDVVVIGAPHEERGQIVKAFIVLVDGATPSPDLEQRFQEYAKSEISPYKYPREIEFLQELPKNEVGKVQRAELRQLQE